MVLGVLIIKERNEKKKMAYNILYHPLQVVLIDMDRCEIPVCFNLGFKFREPGLICLFYYHHQGRLMKMSQIDTLHMLGLPSLTPLFFIGAIRLSHFSTASETLMPADPEPLSQSGSSKPNTNGGIVSGAMEREETDLESLVKALRRWASWLSAVPPPQSIGTARGVGPGEDGLDGVGDLQYEDG